MSSDKHALSLFHIAQRDFKAASAMLDPEVFEDPIFGFHIQQTLEKLLKAWLTIKNVVYTRTHDLENLADMLEEAGVQLSEEIRTELSDITVYAVTMRYLDTPFLDEPIDRAKMLNLVDNLIQTLGSLLRIDP